MYMRIIFVFILTISSCSFSWTAADRSSNVSPKNQCALNSLLQAIKRTDKKSVQSLVKNRPHIINQSIRFYYGGTRQCTPLGLAQFKLRIAHLNGDNKHDLNSIIDILRKNGANNEYDRVYAQEELKQLNG